MSPSRVSPAPGDRRRTWLLLAAGLGLALALRLPALDAAALWADEAISADRAALPWPGLFSLSTLNVQMPVYYAALHGWLRLLGDSDFTLRLFSVVAGLAGLPLLWRAGVRLGGCLAGRVAALWLALHPVHVYFCREARAYALLLSVECGSFALLAPLLAGGGGAGTAAALAGVQALGLSVHLAFAPVAALQGLAVLAVCLRGRRWRALAAYSGVLAAYAAGVLALWLVQASLLPSQWEPRRHPGLAGALEIGGHLLGDGWLYLGALALLGLLAAAWLCRRARPSPPALLLAACAVVPLLLCVAGPLVVPTPVKLRFATPALPPLALLAGLAAARLRESGRGARRAGLALGALAVIGLASGLPPLYRARLHQDWRAVADCVAAACAPGATELVVVLKDEGRLLRRYAAGRFAWEGMDAIGFGRPASPALDTPARRARLAGCMRLLVLDDGWFDATDAAPPWAALAGEFPCREQQVLSRRLNLAVCARQPVALAPPQAFGDLESRLPHVCTR